MDSARQELVLWVPVTPEDGNAVMAEMERLLASPHFRNSKRYPAFLRYVVTARLAGNEQHIKERTLGVEVFNRPLDYDTNSDTVVRFTAGEVRKRLAAYYSEQGAGSLLQISLPVGSYIPEFLRIVNQAPAEPVDATADAPRELMLPPQPSDELRAELPDPVTLTALAQGRSGISLVPWLIVLLLCVLIAAVALGPHFNRETAIDRFWSPLTSASSRVFIYVGTDNAYMPSLAFTRRFKQQHHLSEDQREGTLIPLPLLAAGQTLTADDLYPKNNSLIDAGDLVGCLDTVSYLVQHHRTPDVRVGEDLSAEDLARYPAVFIGAFSDKWTMQTSRSLPFRFDLSTHDYGAIVEQDGQKRIWTAKVEIDEEVAVLEDYSIAARLVNSGLGKPLIIAAGLMAPGSRAASDFITSPESLEASARSAPSDWGRKNLEVVLRTEVVKGRPGPPIVVAVKYW